MATKTKILVGDLFNSYEELEAKITSYQKDNFVQLARRDSRTLDLARKRVPKHVKRANSALVYYSIHNACVFEVVEDHNHEVDKVDKLHI